MGEMHPDVTPSSMVKMTEYQWILYLSLNRHHMSLSLAYWIAKRSLAGNVKKDKGEVM